MSNSQGIPEETGLNLFHDRASAAGSFPHSMLGYDRQSVDTYVREIEQQLSAAKQLLRHMQRQVAAANAKLEASDFEKLGVHTTEILKSADSQAKDLVKQAKLESERIKDEGRRVAADTRAAGQQEADDIRFNGLATMKALREEADRQVAALVEQAKGEAASIISGAMLHAESLRTEAARVAAALAEAARIEADRIRQGAEREAATVRLTSAQEREDLLIKLRGEHEAAASTIAGLMDEARKQQQISADRLADEANEAARIRTAAMADAEAMKVAAMQETEIQIVSTHQQAKILRERVEEQFAWRKEQLERETAILDQRKAGVVAQLRNLASIAQRSVSDFPELADLVDDPDTITAPAEQDVPDDSASAASTESPQSQEAQAAWDAEGGALPEASPDSGAVNSRS